MNLTISTFQEDAPGDLWAEHADLFWPGYRAWFFSEGEHKRPTYLATRRALKTHMPELVGLYDDLVEGAGGSDLVARCLGLYCPAPFISGCSQAVWSRDVPFIVRNYDYASELWEKQLMRTAWLGRRVIGMSDCMWGLLDGMNDAGLALSLSFGGSKAVGLGFGVPLIVRYALQACDTTEQAVAALRRVPCHMAYNITALDAQGDWATVFIGPERPAEVTHRSVITNHQGRVDWAEHATATGSVDRLRVLTSHLDSADETRERFIERFLEPPVYSHEHRRGFGTLYTAVYQPEDRAVTFLWPGYRWEQHLDAFREGEVEIEIDEPSSD